MAKKIGIRPADLLINWGRPKGIPATQARDVKARTAIRREATSKDPGLWKRLAWFRGLCWVKRTWSRDQLQSQTEQAGPTARAQGRQPIRSNSF